MRILQISSAQTIGGGERHLADLANGLTARGHQVYAALRPRSPLITELAALPRDHISTLVLRNALDVQSARSLARLVREHEIEIVHAHLARDYPLAAYATRRNARAELIITRHVLFPMNRLHRIALTHVSRAIAVSAAVARTMRAQKLVPDDRIVVVPNGIPITKFESARARFDGPDWRRQWHIPEDHVLIGSVGEIRTLKGHEDFLRAAAIIVRHFPKTSFLIAGQDPSPTGENRAILERLISDLALANHVRLFGWLDDLPAFYCGLDVFVSASQTESFGLVIAEAMASGTPVVATETEGAKELLVNEESGLLVPVSDVEALTSAVISLIEDPSARRRLATTAARHAQGFAVERMVEQTEEVYREASRNKV